MRRFLITALIAACILAMFRPQFEDAAEYILTKTDGTIQTSEEQIVIDSTLIDSLKVNWDN